MEMDAFNGITRILSAVASSRRQARRALWGVLLGGMAGTLGLAELSEADCRKQSKAKNRKRGNRKRKSKRRCNTARVPLCRPCHEPRCDNATGQYVCHNSCPAGFGCCNGLCQPPCDNGCQLNPANACSCDAPPTGTTYCAAKHVCVSTECPDGSTFNPEQCECQCSDERFVCPADQRCCASFTTCTMDGCCHDHQLCERGGVLRCCQ